MYRFPNSRLLIWLALLDSFFLGSCISIVTIKPTIIHQISKTIPLFRISRFTFFTSKQSFLSSLFKIVATQKLFPRLGVRDFVVWTSLCQLGVRSTFVYICCGFQIFDFCRLKTFLDSATKSCRFSFRPSFQ